MNPSSLQLDEAVKLHQRGDLRRAEFIYQQILQQNSGNADAWHLLGVIALQEKRHDQAIDCIRKAIHLHPAAALMHANLGVAYKALKRNSEAEACYRQALILQPDYAEAQFNLGRLLQEQGKQDEAAAAYRNAVRIKPDYAEAYNSLGQTLREQGQFTEAMSMLQIALKLRPAFPEAHINFGNILRDLKKPAQAAASYQEALRLKPDLAEAHNNLGCLYQEEKRLDDAVACFRQALLHKADFADARRNLGIVLPELGMVYLDRDQLDEAKACFEEALQIDPTPAMVHNNLGTILDRQGKLTEAKARFETAIRLQPSLAIAYSNLGRILLSEGATERARESFEKAAQHDLQMFSAHYNLGLLFSKDENKLDQAEAAFRRAVEIEPDNATGHEALAALLAGQGKWAESIRCYDRAEQLAPTHWRRLKAAMTLPAILESTDQMHLARRHVYDAVARLLTENRTGPSPVDPQCMGFYLAYHGLNERALRMDQGRIYLKTSPDLAYVAPHCREGKPKPAGAGRIKIGFVSTHFRNHTIGRLNAGLIRQLDRKRFHVIVMRKDRQDDDLARLIGEGADQVLVSPDSNNLSAARQIIAEQELDVVFYPDIGMEPWTYLLSFARLAPVQCVTWGHPLTTGVPAVDYFISSESLEADGAEEHYSERLVRLKNLAVYYYRPKLPVPGKNRADFGLPQEAHIYGCLQTLFKFHPEFDPILGGILRRDPEGILLIIQQGVPHWKKLLLDRFQKTMPDVIGRIRFVPPQYHEHYLCLTALCDVVLDPLHFGGGNSSYEALALGVPIITLPSPFLRGRITLAQYRQMDVPDCVAGNPAEYIDLAVRCGTDRDFKSAVSRKIQEANHALFEDNEGVRQLEDFLEKVVRGS